MIYYFLKAWLLNQSLFLLFSLTEIGATGRSSEVRRRPSGERGLGWGAPASPCFGRGAFDRLPARRFVRGHLGRETGLFRSVSPWSRKGPAGSEAPDFCALLLRLGGSFSVCREAEVGLRQGSRGPREAKGPGRKRPGRSQQGRVQLLTCERPSRTRAALEPRQGRGAKGSRVPAAPEGKWLSLPRLLRTSAAGRVGVGSAP